MPRDRYLMRSGRDMILTIEALVLTAMMIISAAAGIVSLID